MSYIKLAREIIYRFGQSPIPNLHTYSFLIWFGSFVPFFISPIILLYSMRICLQTSSIEKSDGFLYAQLLSPYYKKAIEENCIPGNNLIEELPVITYYEVEKHLREKPLNIGAYVCSCGYYYSISPCGFPWEPKDKKQTLCPICKKPIGYSEKLTEKGQHGMAIRPGHYRVFKNMKDKTQQLRLYGDSDENISSIILSDYKKNIIDPILKKSRFGINSLCSIQ